MSDKFSLYQTDGLWGIIENTSNEKQTSIKSYFGSDLIIKRLNEQADQLDQLKQQLDESFTEEDVDGLIEDRDKTIKFLQQQLTEKQNTIDEINKEFVQAVHDWKVLCAEKDKEIEDCKRNELYEENMKILAVKNQTQLAIQELEKVNGILTDTIIEVTQDEFDLNKLCYLEEISEKFYEKIHQQINELKGENDERI